MAFIHKVIAPDEKLIGIARLHWIYGLKGLLWLVGLMGAGIIIKFYLYDFMGGVFAPVANALFWIGTIMGGIFALFYIIMMLTTELGLTTKKCIYKRGWIFVDTREVDLEEIKSTDVDNGILGRFLNYGYIHMDARFIEDVGLPAIADPYRFVKALNVVKTEIKDDSMKLILDDGSVKQNQKIQHDEEDDINTLEHNDYKALEDDAINNVKETLSIDSDAKKDIKNKPKRSDYIKSDHENTKPLKKKKKEHLKEEIIEDFEEVEGEIDHK